MPSEPIIESTEPIMESTEPTMESTEPTMESTEPTMESTEPTMESTEPNTESANAPPVESHMFVDIYELCEASDFDLEGRNDAGETPLLVKVRDNELDCVTALLLQGADATAKDNQGNGALHLAVTTGNLELIKILIVFGAEINVWNNRKITPRHILACSPSGGNRDTLLHYLHVLGAYRCEDEESFESLSEMIAVRTECQEGCSENGCFNGTPPEMTSQTTGRVDKFLVHVDVSTAMHTGDRVLCLDGGGVRGLVLIQTLLEIEQLTDRPIAECFDWIVGTSTGGILALAIAHGVPMRTFQSLYFQMKDDVFEGGKPYDHNALEKFLKDVFGENTKMTDFKPDSPKVAVTSVLADRLPAKLHLFRNYDPPPTHSTVEETDGGKFTPVKNPKDELIWEAARSTGAAPVYFRPHKNYIDGGMMSNNPTLDALTEIHEYNKAKGESRPERAVDVVVSLGTGLPPTKPSHVPDIHHPDGLFKVIKCVDMVWDAKSLGDLLLHQVTQSESQTVERCSAWCSMIGVPFFRFNPPFDEHIPLDCKDDSKLIDMVWQTKLYLHRHHEQLKTLALLLNRL